MHKPFLRTASLLGALAVALGAFGAHALKGRVSDVAANTFETAVRYQFYHVLALLMLGVLYKELKNKWILLSGNLFIAGIVLFSGSLYALTFLTTSVNQGFKWIGIITPIGGLAFIAGWFCLLMGVMQKRHFSK
jgi:uncharacterized membrane protein YgdD (TMEM256/DUF423 family)